jgi:hypothetical protein
MHFYSGQLMHFYSGVDNTPRAIQTLLKLLEGIRKLEAMSGSQSVDALRGRVA